MFDTGGALKCRCQPPPGRTVIRDEASVGLLQVFLDAGYEVVGTPTLRRRVVRHRLSEQT